MANLNINITPFHLFNSAGSSASGYLATSKGCFTDPEPLSPPTDPPPPPDTN